MKPVRPISRRSFLARVVGTAIAGGPALGLAAGRAAAQARQMVVDADPSDPARVPMTDLDQGATADPANLGRGNAEQRRAGITDADIGAAKDPPELGRGPVRRQRNGNPRPTVAPPGGPVTDSDSAANADASGMGRRSGGGGPTSRFVSCPGHPRCPRGGGR